MEVIIKTLCDYFGDTAKYIVKKLADKFNAMFNDDRFVYGLYTLMGGEKLECLDLKELFPEIEKLDILQPSDFSLFLTNIINEFLVIAHELLGEDGLYALIKAISINALKEYGENALNELLRRIGLSAHRPSVEYRKEGDEIIVRLYVYESLIRDALNKSIKRGTVITLLAALIASEGKDVIYKDMRRIDKNVYEYVYKVAEC